MEKPSEHIGTLPNYRLIAKKKAAGGGGHMEIGHLHGTTLYVLPECTCYQHL